jgi:hypothetical protein
MREPDQSAGPTVSAVLTDGPLNGLSVDVELVEARPPSTVELRADDGTTCRYCLSEWTQAGPSALCSLSLSRLAR